MKNTHLRHMLAAAAFGAAFAAAPAARAHARLQASEPQAGSLVERAPQQVRLRFNENVELPFSKVTLVDQHSAAILPSRVDLDKSDPKALVATLPSLLAGPYRVQWSTMTRDGHKVKGEFGFRVK